MFTQITVWVKVIILSKKMENRLKFAQEVLPPKIQLSEVGMAVFVCGFLDGMGK